MSRKWPILLPAEVLERLSDEEFWSYAHELASPAPSDTDTEAETLSEEYLRCQLRSGDYLIPLKALHEVMLPPQDGREAHPYALLPAIPAWMVGVFSWRGETIAVIDLDAYFSTIVTVPGNDPTSASTLLIADCSGTPVGLLVPTIGPATIQSEVPVLELQVILEDIVQQIKEACLT